MWTCAGLLALVACAGAVTRDQFYPHGWERDQQLPRERDQASPEITLNVPIVFYGETYETIFVNKFGVLSFRADIPTFLNTEFPLPYPSIAAFYSNIDTSQSGSIWYRETNESHVLAKAEESVQNNFHDYYDFKPLSVFITTWLDVTYADSNQERKNSFQIAVISNGTESFVEFLYPEREIQWIHKETQPQTLPEAKAQAGFISEDGRYFALRGSGSHQIRNIVSWSNSQEPGKYVFRIGLIPLDGNIAVPDQYDESEIEIEEESKTCAQSGPSVCHTHARCVDYQAGICCQCNDGFYGNGKSCIKNDVPRRVHGRINGVLNNVNLNDVDIQSYVVVADGRSYTALSQAPPNFGNSLLFLNVLGGVVGWLFAKPSGTAQNGYQLTGSVFNHTAEIFFPATNDSVSIFQTYIGHDVFDQITLETLINGTIPALAPGTKVEISEYEENYSIVYPGLVQSASTRTFVIKGTGQKYEERILQTFSYTPCRFAPSSEENVPMILKINKNYLGYEERENIVRYGMSNKISNSGLEDPCMEGRSSCGAHSTCLVQGESFSCVCQSGFTSLYVEDAITCVDIDECVAGTHNCDPNAYCYNHDGGFQCRCRQDYEGDGTSCRVTSRCSTVNCDPNAKCVENYGEAAYCVCNPGFTGNGQRCWQVQVQENNCDNCSSNGYCAFSPFVNYYKCVCNLGYLGDGFDCVKDPSYVEYTTETEVHLISTPSSTTSTVTEVEYNESYVLPECNGDGCVCPPGYSNYRDDSNNDLCRMDNYNAPNPFPDTNDTAITCKSDSDCPPNAVCSYIPAEPFALAPEFGHCVCPEGYEGDAYECIERTGSSCACGTSAHCIDTAAGEYICVCDTGYHGDGYTCRPNFSCTNNSDCEYNAECRLDPISSENVCQCIEGYIKDQNDACIPDGQLCNGAVCPEHASCLYDAKDDVSYCHCDDGYEGDDISRCERRDTCAAVGGCDQNALCTSVDNSYVCICKEGFVGNGYTCTKEENCRINPYLCDVHASCLKTSDIYQCECNVGYNGNGSYCELNPRLAGNFLVASDGATVYRVPFRNTPRDFATPLNSAMYQIAVGVDVDCVTGKIYWGDVVSNSIKRASYDGSNYEQFLTNDVKYPEGLAVDWSSRNIFWTDSKKFTIEVANMDTKTRKVLFSGTGLVNPRGIAVHPALGKIFWSDWNRDDPKIEWANMDGSQRGIFLDSQNVRLPNSLAMDWARDRLCFADAGLFSIRCVSIETREIETIAANCSHPFGLAINGDKYYWTDWRTKKIEYIDATTQVRGLVPITTAARMFGVTVAPDQCPGATSRCQYRNGNCEPSQLCLPTGYGASTCVDPEPQFDNYIRK